MEGLCDTVNGTHTHRLHSFTTLVRFSSMAGIWIGLELCYTLEDTMGKNDVKGWIESIGQGE